MFAPNRIIFFLACVLCFSSCGWRAAKSEDAPAAAPFAAEELKSAVPFATKEPENFQAEFVIVANDSQNKIFTARAGNRRRYDYDSGASNQLTVLQTGAGQNFLLLPRDKIYAENFTSQTSPAEKNPQNFLTSELLNQKPDADFKRLGAENGLTKYAVRLNDSDAAETIIFVDEQIDLPVRQEFYTTKDGQRILTYTVEMRNFKSPADENLFEVPKDFRKVSIEILRAAIRETKKNGE